jgi:hypothetical protein
MPCDQIVKNSLKLENAIGHLDVLADTLREMGYSVIRDGERLTFSGNGLSGTFQKGRFDTRSYNGAKLDGDAINQKFGVNVVKKGAKQFGWDFKVTGENKIQISKVY